MLSKVIIAPSLIVLEPRSGKNKHTIVLYGQKTNEYYQIEVLFQQFSGSNVCSWGVHFSCSL